MVFAPSFRSTTAKHPLARRARVRPPSFLFAPGPPRRILSGMGGQGFVPEDGQGALVEGAKETKQLEQQSGPAHGAPRAGMQGTKERGAAGTTILPRPGTTPEKGGR